MQEIEAFVGAHPGIVTQRISADGQTPLHVAVFYQHEMVVTMLVDRVSREHLGVRDENGQTPLHYSAINGNINIAKCMIRGYRDLANFDNRRGEIPAVLACRHGDREMTLFLCNHTSMEALQGKNGALLLSYCIICKFLGKRE